MRIWEKSLPLFVIVITLVSTAFFVMHTWWLPPDISTTGPAVDRQFDETLIGTGVLFFAGAIVLAWFAWRYQRNKPKTRERIALSRRTDAVGRRRIVRRRASKISR